MPELNFPKFLVILSISATPAAAGAADFQDKLQPTAADAKAVGELLLHLAGEGLDADPGALANERAQQALSSLLRRGFAQTPTIQRTVESLFAEPLRMMRQPSWLDELERRGAQARLRGHSAHAGAQDVDIAYDIPLADHELVDVYIDHFTGRGRWYFFKWLSRAGRYLPIMQPILEKNGLPRDLVY
ncbi:MAG: hypothetical protein V3T05_05980, partial [Myxococcota bacterium]